MNWVEGTLRERCLGDMPSGREEGQRSPACRGRRV